MTARLSPSVFSSWPFTVDGSENAASKDQSGFHAVGTDRWSRNREKPGIQRGDLIQSNRNPL